MGSLKRAFQEAFGAPCTSFARQRHSLRLDYGKTSRRKLCFVGWCSRATGLLWCAVPAASDVDSRFISACPLADDLHCLVLPAAAFRPAASPSYFGACDVWVRACYFAGGGLSICAEARAIRAVCVHVGPIVYVPWFPEFHCLRAILHGSAPARDRNAELATRDSRPAGELKFAAARSSMRHISAAAPKKSGDSGLST